MRLHPIQMTTSKLPVSMGSIAALLGFFYNILAHSDLVPGLVSQNSMSIISIVDELKLYSFILSDFICSIIRFILSQIYKSEYFGTFEHIGFMDFDGVYFQISYSIAIRFFCDILFGFFQWYWIGRFIVWLRLRLGSRHPTGR